MPTGHARCPGYIQPYRQRRSGQGEGWMRGGCVESGAPVVGCTARRGAEGRVQRKGVAEPGESSGWAVMCGSDDAQAEGAGAVDIGVRAHPVPCGHCLAWSGVPEPSPARARGVFYAVNTSGCGTSHFRAVSWTPSSVNCASQHHVCEGCCGAQK